MQPKYIISGDNYSPRLKLACTLLQPIKPEPRHVVGFLDHYPTSPGGILHLAVAMRSLSLILWSWLWVGLCFGEEVEIVCLTRQRFHSYANKSIRTKTLRNQQNVRGCTVAAHGAARWNHSYLPSSSLRTKIYRRTRSLPWQFSIIKT